MQVFRSFIRPFVLLMGLFIAGWVYADPASAETVYVQAKTAQLRAGKTSLDKVTADVRYADALEVLRRDGSWVEVKTASGQRGWIFANKLSDTKPAGSDGELVPSVRLFGRRKPPR